MNAIFYNGQLLVDFNELADKYTKAEIDAMMTTLFTYKGSVATYTDLTNIPTSGLKVGDCYNVLSDGSNYAWDGTSWDLLSGVVDLSNYYNKSQIDTAFQNLSNTYYNKTEIDNMIGGLDSQLDNIINGSQV